MRWVHISELEDPTPWLSGGELLLTTGMALADAEQQREYVARLARHGLAGLGLGTGFRTRRCPTAMVEAADEHGFPLFEVPYELPFIALTEKAFTHLVNEQYALLRRALAAHERLERIVLSEQGLDGVAGALAALVGGPALVFDGRGEVLASAGRRSRTRGRRLGAELRERARAGARRGFAPGGELEGRALALPVARAAGGRGGRAAGVARGRQGRRPADGVRPPDAAPGRDDRRARAAAPADGRRHRAPPGRRRADRAGLRRAGGRRAGAPAGAVRARRPRRDARARPAAAASRRAVEDALARAVRDEAAAGLVAGTGRFTCALLPAPRGAATRSCSRSPSACARASRAKSGTRLEAGAGRAVARRRRRRDVPRGALRARGARARPGTANGAGAGSPPTTTSAPSSCCSRCRTTRRCGCSATRSSRRSRTARAPTAAS